MKTRVLSKKNRRLLQLFAIYGIADLAKGRKPVKTAVKLAAACGRTEARIVKEKGKRAVEGTRLAGAVAEAAAYRDPKEIKRRNRKKKIIHFLLRKLA